MANKQQKKKADTVPIKEAGASHVSPKLNRTRDAAFRMHAPALPLSRLLACRVLSLSSLSGQSLNTVIFLLPLLHFISCSYYYPSLLSVCHEPLNGDRIDRTSGIGPAVSILYVNIQKLVAVTQQTRAASLHSSLRAAHPIIGQPTPSMEGR
jgi:hypothetical protein